MVGAGLVGGLWALMLAQRGNSVHLYERRSDPRQASVVGGRSINLALSERGWKALEKAGVADAVREIALPINGRLMHAVDGNLTFQRYGIEGREGRFGDGQCIYSVSRSGLNRLLVEAATSHPGVEVRFNHTCSSIDFSDGTLAFANGNSSQYDRIFGSDGAFSAVRNHMARQDRFDVEQRYLEHGYLELAMRPEENGDFKMRADTLHIWPRGEFMLMALPNPDGTFTCTLFAPFERKQGIPGLEDLNTNEEVMAYFEEHFPDVPALIPDLLDQWNAHPVSSLVMIRCEPWHNGNRVALLGDAAHAIVPFYGQGMNSGFEDCSVLSELIDAMESPDQWGEVLARYTQKRKPAGDGIRELALRNYVEMRDLTADPRFLLQKRIEARLAKQYPDEWRPLYNQVTFTHTPYHHALAAGKMQYDIMQRVMNRPDIEAVWDSEEVAEAAIHALRQANTSNPSNA